MTGARRCGCSSGVQHAGCECSAALALTVQRARRNPLALQVRSLIEGVDALALTEHAQLYRLPESCKVRLHVCMVLCVQQHLENIRVGEHWHAQLYRLPESCKVGLRIAACSAAS